jgi:hypothetical protein
MAPETAEHTRRRDETEVRRTFIGSEYWGMLLFISAASANQYSGFWCATQ